MAKYGRDEETWKQLTDAGLEFLIECARRRDYTTYSDLNNALVERAGLPGFDFERADERAAMGYLLGLIVEKNRPETNLMISALVMYQDGSDAGTGFYNLATELDLLPPGAPKRDKEKFWLEQFTQLWEHYSPVDRPRPY